MTAAGVTGSKHGLQRASRYLRRLSEEVVSRPARIEQSPRLEFRHKIGMDLVGHVKALVIWQNADQALGGILQHITVVCAPVAAAG